MALSVWPPFPGWRNLCVWSPNITCLKTRPLWRCWQETGGSSDRDCFQDTSDTPFCLFSPLGDFDPICPSEMLSTVQEERKGKEEKKKPFHFPPKKRYFISGWEGLWKEGPRVIQEQSFPSCWTSAGCVQCEEAAPKISAKGTAWRAESLRSHTSVTNSLIMVWSLCQGSNLHEPCS